MTKTVKLTEPQRKFLQMLRHGYRDHIPPSWDEEYRHALSEGWVHIGWGGVKELTEAGRAALQGRTDNE